VLGASAHEATQIEGAVGVVVVLAELLPPQPCKKEQDKKRENRPHSFMVIPLGGKHTRIRKQILHKDLSYFLTTEFRWTEG
jgi:hypothetical protein